MKEEKKKRKHKDYKSGEEAKRALRIFLRYKHRKYTIDDVLLSSVRGYVKTTKPCFCTYPPFDGSYIGIDSGAKQSHFHTISLCNVFPKDKRYPYQLWDALKKFNVLEQRDKEECNIIQKR